MLSGAKLVEFRKVRMRKHIHKMIIYATAPVSAVVAVVTVVGVEEATPQLIWERFAEIGAISHEDFLAYYGDRVNAVAIRIANVTTLDNSVRLRDLCPQVRAPQSFVYLPVEFVENIART